MISIIIPAYNEEDGIGKLVHHLHQHSEGEVAEIIVVDGLSDDDTVSEAQKAGASVRLSPQRNRAVQMNEGAYQASGEILYFVHADTLPPSTFVSDIYDALRNGSEAGCFRSRFDRQDLLYKFNAFFTHFDLQVSRGGDQTLFITRQLFKQLAGFRNDYVIMEDYELIERARKQASFQIIPKYVVVSARKYERNSWLRVQLAYWLVHFLYRLGVSQQRLLNTYKALIDHPKL